MLCSCQYFDVFSTVQYNDNYEINIENIMHVIEYQ